MLNEEQLDKIKRELNDLEHITVESAVKLFVYIERLDEENKRLQAAVEPLLELRDFVKGNLELAKRRAEVIKDDRLDHIIFPLGAQMGYGAIMDSAARAWYLKDSNGSHTIGGATLVAKNLVAKTAPRGERCVIKKRMA